MSDTDNVARKAIEVLNRRGWHQGNWEGQDGSVCLAGAMSYAVGRYHGWTQASLDAADVVCRIIAEQFPDRPVRCGAQFNDHPDTTLDDVLLVLEKAAIRLDEDAS